MLLHQQQTLNETCFPNGIFTVIQIPNRCSYCLDMYDIIGKKLFKTGNILMKGQDTIPLMKKEPGTYILRFQSEKITHIRTIAVTR